MKIFNININEFNVFQLFKNIFELKDRERALNNAIDSLIRNEENSVIKEDEKIK